MRDERGPLSTNPEVAALVARDDPPAYAPAHLALVTIMHCAAELSDRHAAAAVRRRSDWKYALALPLAATGFDAAILSEFCSRLLVGNAKLYLFDAMLTLFRDQGLSVRGAPWSIRLTPPF